VLPLELPAGRLAIARLTGEEVFDSPPRRYAPAARNLTVRATSRGQVTEFTARVRIDTPVELDYYRKAASCRRVRSC